MIEKVQFYLDPSCPWCWVSSQWLKEVADIRSVNVEWLPFSLALKNDEIVPQDSDTTPYGDEHRSSHRVLRLIEAAVDAYGEEARYRLYYFLAKEYHTNSTQKLYTNEAITKALASCDYELPLDACDDIAYDRDLQKHLDNAIDVVGVDSGVPTIIFCLSDGKKFGYFGPIITDLPSTEDGLRLWDNLSALATLDTFYEIKRTRTKDVNPQSTLRIE